MKSYEEIAKSSRRSIKELEEHNENSLFDECQLVADGIVYHTLIATACEKQVAKKPDERFNKIGYITDCPNCGQKIDWSEK